MSFGWSAGDIIAGFKLACDIYESVSDGPLNATHQAQQFFTDFRMINKCLEDWDRRRNGSQNGDETILSVPLREQCTDFIKRHMRLIQEVNGNTGATRDVLLIDQGDAGAISTPERVTWLKKVPFTKDQVIALYLKVAWPSERDHVARLQKELSISLQVATYQGVAATIDGVNNMHSSIRALSVDVRNIAYILSSNLNEKAIPVGGSQLNRVEYSAQNQPISPTTQTLQFYDQSNTRHPPPGRVQTIDAIPAGRPPENSVAVSQSSNSSESPQYTPLSSPSTGPSPLLGPVPGDSPQAASPIFMPRSFQNSLSQNNLSPRLGSISQSSSRSFHLDSSIPVNLYYGGKNDPAPALIECISRSRDGAVQSIMMSWNDRSVQYIHTIDPDLSKSAPCETSMTPSLNNKRVKKEYDFLVQFLGAHKLKIIEVTKQGPSVEQIRSAPKYVFGDDKYFLKFQFLLLQKEVKHCADVYRIEAFRGGVQCHEGTIRILYDPIYKTRSILYFRQKIKKSLGRFVEWSVNIFQEPPTPQSSKNLRLKSLDGKTSLSLSQIYENDKYPRQSMAGQNASGWSMSAQSSSSQNTQGSISSIGSLASTTHTTSLGKPEPLIMGLVLKFYSETECEDFWKKFTTKDIVLTKPNYT